MLNWPQNSPDFNPIEHLWDVLDKQVRSMEAPPRNLQDLKDLLLTYWCQIPQLTLRDLVKSISQWPFRGGLAGVFWITVLLQNPSSLQLEVTNLPIYQSGKGYKATSKALGLPRTTVRAIIYKWRKHGTVENLPRSGRPTKITPRVQRRLIQEVTKDPTTTSKELQASLASVKVSFHDSTIKKNTGQKWFAWQSSKTKTAAEQKEHKGSSQF
ncbi:hypothetical protein QTP70_022374 [Hemibagrus guttatus]|uniref:Sleeping Beauty transposase HTH domain-containing protein n=1 Tax=Hemibagrus guttatus TaxID=175788 RepID=A0AAE0RKG1_9TELE|nr:hypothetical protein QTP70_022374 [Hemibagrus guttatus]